MAERLKKTDIVVIGLGATGGLAAMLLTQAGLEVTAIEAGGPVSFRDFPSDEIRMGRNWLGRAKFNNEIPSWRARPTETATGTITSRYTNAIGGSSIHWGCQSWRFLPVDFRVRSATIERYGVGALPPGADIRDWPLTYAELEPYYDKAEYYFGVSGKAGNLRGKIDPRGNVLEGPRRREYPLPPLRRSGWTELVGGAMRRKGYHPFPGPAGIRSREYRGLPSCQYCGFCSSNGCHASAKNTTYLDAIPAALKTDKLKIVSRARVTVITNDADGKASGVLYIKGGRTYFQPASLVVLCTFTWENNRTLLLSKSRAYPNGMSNNHGQVGKYYMRHPSMSVSGLFPARRLNRFGGTGAQFVGMDDFNGDNFDHTGLGFIQGAQINAGMGALPLGTVSALPPSVPQWGSEWKRWLKANANSVGSITAQTEQLPYENNFIDLDPIRRDPQGLPIARTTNLIGANEKAMYAFVGPKLRELLLEAGASETWGATPTDGPGSTHATGGTRMGTDEDSSVVDRWGLSHEVPNLAIMGASLFPTMSGYNPTETIFALTWRTSDYIAKNWKSLTT